MAYIDSQCMYAPSLKRARIRVTWIKGLRRVAVRSPRSDVSQSEP